MDDAGLKKDRGKTETLDRIGFRPAGEIEKQRVGDEGAHVP